MSSSTPLKPDLSLGYSDSPDPLDFLPRSSLPPPSSQCPTTSKLSRLMFSSSTKRGHDSSDAVEEEHEAEASGSLERQVVEESPKKRNKVRNGAPVDKDLDEDGAADQSLTLTGDLDPAPPSPTPVRTKKSSNRAKAPPRVIIPKAPKSSKKPPKGKATKKSSKGPVASSSSDHEPARPEKPKDAFSPQPPASQSLKAIVAEIDAKKASPAPASASSSQLSTLPPPSSQLTPVPSSSLSTLGPSSSQPPPPSSVETPWSRADVVVPGRVVWVAVDGVVWWPGKVSKTAPLAGTVEVELLKVETDQAVDFPPATATVEPSPTTLLTFKAHPSTSLVRFPTLASATIASEFPSPHALPASSVFTNAVSRARFIQVQAAMDDDDELPDADEAMLLDAAAGSTWSQSIQPSQLTAAGAAESEPEVDEPAEEEEEEEEEYDEGPDDELEIPGEIVLAADKHPDRSLHWWPARVLDYVGLQLPPGPKRGKAAKRKRVGCYKVLYCDGSEMEIPREWFATEYEDAFFDKPLGEVRSTDTISAETISDDIQPHIPALEKTILGDPSSSAEAKHRDFMAGGNRRRRLGESAVYGSYSESAIQAVAQVIKEHFLLSPDRPQGEDEFEALTDAEKLAYCTDVLVPEAIFLRTVAEHLEEAEVKLREEKLREKREGEEEGSDEVESDDEGEGGKVKVKDGEPGGEEVQLDEKEIREKAEDLAKRCLRQEDFFYQVIDRRKEGKDRG